MNISVSGTESIRNKGFEYFVRLCLMRALSLISRRIKRVDVAVTDMDGPRGGIDKHCRIRVQMRGVEPFVATAKDECPWAAASRAIRRAQRKVIIKLRQLRSQRERFSSNRYSNSDTPDLERRMDAAPEAMCPVA